MFDLKKIKNNSGFTLIEILFVIGIISLLSSVILTNMHDARKMGRDAKRLIDMKEIQKALEFYYDENGRYPSSDVDGCGGWDVGNQDFPFISGGLVQSMPNPPEDAVGTGNCNGYRYYRYSAGSYGCPVSKGAYYVLGVTDMETSARPHPESVGWSCPSRNWQNEMDWVIGRFERQ
ncbi:MAG: type II secretion system protein [Candidatus Pacebacteria bacterium]|nr:type II secretion system protein [Candidatus Paceibacterota bacterium]